jgi:hypothetical protein
MKKLTFIRTNLSDVRVIMTIMRVRVIELLCQMTMRQIPVLKYLPSGACGRLWSCPVVPDIKCCCFPRSWLQWCLPGTVSPWDPGRVLSTGGGMRRVGLIGGEIIPAHCYRDRVPYQYGALGSQAVCRWRKLVVPRFFTVADDPQYPRYKTPTIMYHSL